MAGWPRSDGEWPARAGRPFPLVAKARGKGDRLMISSLNVCFWLIAALSQRQLSTHGKKFEDAGGCRPQPIRPRFARFGRSDSELQLSLHQSAQALPSACRAAAEIGEGDFAQRARYLLCSLAGHRQRAVNRQLQALEAFEPFTG